MTSEAATPEASGTPAPADCFTIGVLVGAIEDGDLTSRFGSLGAFEQHRAVAIAHRVVTPSGRPTTRGIDLYDRHNLGALPLGRAYLWPAESTASALAELNKECE